MFCLKKWFILVELVFCNPLPFFRKVWWRLDESQSSRRNTVNQSGLLVTQLISSMPTKRKTLNKLGMSLTTLARYTHFEFWVLDFVILSSLSPVLDFALHSIDLLSTRLCSLRVAKWHVWLFTGQWMLATHSASYTHVHEKGRAGALNIAPYNSSCIIQNFPPIPFSTHPSSSLPSPLISHHPFFSTPSHPSLPIRK